MAVRRELVFDETAQLVSAKVLKQNGAKNIQLEKTCSAGEIDIYAEFGTSQEIWEVKPTGQYQNAHKQLTKYKNATGYAYGRAVGNIGDAFEIRFMHKVYMQVSFSRGTYQGAITYKFIKRYTKWGKQYEEEKSNAQVKKGIETGFGCATIVAGTIIVATISEDVLTGGAGIWNDGPSLTAAANSFSGMLKFGFWLVGLA